MDNFIELHIKAEQKLRDVEESSNDFGWTSLRVTVFLMIASLGCLEIIVLIMIISTS